VFVDSSLKGCNAALEMETVPVYFLTAKQGYTVRKMVVVYIDFCRCEIQEEKEIPVWYTGIYRPISSTVGI
jgi:hypothetical protein